VADMAISVGAVLIIIDGLFFQSASETEDSAEAPVVIPDKK